MQKQGKYILAGWSPKKYTEIFACDEGKLWLRLAVVVNFD